MRTWAVIPVKALGQTKSRLAGVLSLEQRATLTVRLLARTLDLLCRVGGVERTLVVTRDPVVGEVSVGHAAEVLWEKAPGGLNTAVGQSVAHLARLDVARALILPSDLPLLQADEIRLLLDGARGGAMALSSDQRGEGTNGLVVPTTAVVEFQFGPQSFMRHRQEAARRGLACRVVAAPGLAFDLDTAVDWEWLCGELSPPSPFRPCRI